MRKVQGAIETDTHGAVLGPAVPQAHGENGGSEIRSEKREDPDQSRCNNTVLLGEFDRYVIAFAWNEDGNVISTRVYQPIILLLLLLLEAVEAT